jgi:hypothetical protein
LYNFAADKSIVYILKWENIARKGALLSSLQEVS